MASSPQYILSSLLVFKNTLHQELVRSLHVYKLLNNTDDDGWKMEIEREFLFPDKGSYVELKVKPCLTLHGCPVVPVVEGQLMELWLCIFSFQGDGHPQFTNIPPILSVSRNPKLRAVPTLAKELEIIFKSSPRIGREEPSQTVQTEMHKGNENNEPRHSPIKMSKASREKYHCSRVHHMFGIDLNSSPNLVATRDRSDPGILVHKRRRAAPEDIASLTLENIAKYFDLPIAKASKQLNVGLTVLKKKCREFGIPRWPHRKIKSLDNLIHNFQEESKRINRIKSQMMQLRGGEKCWKMKRKQLKESPLWRYRAKPKGLG